MRVATLRGFRELVDDMLRRWAIRIAHAEINDVLAAGSRLLLELANNVEDVGRGLYRNASGSRPSRGIGRSTCRPRLPETRRQPQPNPGGAT